MKIEEHVALARWGADTPARRLVNIYGEVFAGDLPDTAQLPQLLGGPGRQRSRK